jgi:DNA-binding XRE family transcriptional regulator
VLAARKAACRAAQNGLKPRVAHQRYTDTTLTVADAQLIRKRLAENVRRQRENAGFSQDALADVSVVGRSTIQRIEKGEQEPRISTLVAFAVALNVPFDAFMAGLPVALTLCELGGGHE